MKKLTTIFAALFLCLGMAQAQDVYYSGNSKIWKNDSLLYNLTDSISIQLKAIQVTDSGAVYGAGYAFDTAGIQGRIWMNDSCVFTGDTNTYFDHLALTANGWTMRTAVCMLIFTLFHFPCATTCMTIRRETGSLKWTLLSIVLPTAAGAVMCLAANALLTLCGV